MWKTIGFVLGLGLAFAPSEALACRCLQTDVVSSWRSNDLAVFGRIVAERTTGQSKIYTVVVRKDLKTCIAPGTRIQVRTALSSAACGTTLAVGETWFISGGDGGLTGRGMQRLDTSSCDFNAPRASLSASDFAFLETRLLSCPGGDVCADGSNPVSCLVDPCAVAGACPGAATCESNYCGGCTAETYDANGFGVCRPW